MTLAQFALVNLGALITAIGGVFLKRLSTSTPDNIGFRLVLDVASNWNFWLGGFCYVVPVIVWAYLLRTMELTKLQPMLAIVYIYSVGLAVMLLGERPSLERLLGILVISVGVVLVGRS